MNYLELVQDLFAEAELAGTAPTTVVGLTGRQQDLARWVADAWDEISDDRQDWLFKLVEFSFSTSSLAASYDPVVDLSLTDFADWHPRSFRYYLTSVGLKSELFVADIPYPEFRDYYLYGSRHTETGPPLAVSSAPDKKLLVGPVPNTDYTIVGQYVSVKSRLTDDTDTPGMPARLHKAIVWKALEQYALSESAPEALAKAERGQLRFGFRIRKNQLPKPRIGAPLA
jgi:hypothetical protein